jgi:opacity protein-like surface antigen
MSFSVPAEDMQLDANLLLSRFDAGGNDDFKSNKAFAAFYNYYLKDWIAVNAGLLVSDKALDESRKDIVGTYRASLQSSSILLGIKPRYKFSSPYEVFGRLGLQYWQTELEVEEYFNDNIPEGSSSITDTGYGYYFGFGGAYYVTNNVVVQLELSRFTQLDVFNDDSIYPFDLEMNALSFGVGYRF